MTEFMTDVSMAYCSLRTLELTAGDKHEFDTGDTELLVLPLAGSCHVSCAGRSFDVQGRTSVFSRVTDFVYVPRDTRVTLTGTGRFALPAARCDRSLPPRYAAAKDVPVELRGAGQASRQVNNFCTPEAFEADKLIACEVLTPGGNWSSYPPHKHDEDRPGESVLEEIYYFEIATRPNPAGLSSAGRDGMGYQRVYGTADRPIDILEEVRTGDTVRIPHGWHGPSMAVPGYDLYYLNVMAGPSAERAWLICDDPAHTWIRDTWRDQPIDFRLPMTTPEERSRP